MRPLKNDFRLRGNDESEPFFVGAMAEEWCESGSGVEKGQAALMD